jgi:hypothetical protein
MTDPERYGLSPEYLTPDERLDAERRAFIRTAAIALWAAAPVGHCAETAWENAKMLWDAKPEDV